MQRKYDPDIKLDRFGDPDVEYYIREAERQRAEAISALFRDLVRWLRKSFGKGQGRPMRTAH